MGARAGWERGRYASETGGSRVAEVGWVYAHSHEEWEADSESKLETSAAKNGKGQIRSAGGGVVG